MTSTGILDGQREWVLSRETLARWINVGGLRAVLRDDKRWVEMKAESRRGGLLSAFLWAFVEGCCWASRDTM